MMRPEVEEALREFGADLCPHDDCREQAECPACLRALIELGVRLAVTDMQAHVEKFMTELKPRSRHLESVLYVRDQIIPRITVASVLEGK